MISLIIEIIGTTVFVGYIPSVMFCYLLKLYSDSTLNDINDKLIHITNIVRLIPFINTVWVVLLITTWSLYSIGMLLYMLISNSTRDMKESFKELLK
jgi:hypothetical protein